MRIVVVLPAPFDPGSRRSRRAGPRTTRGPPPRRAERAGQVVRQHDRLRAAHWPVALASTAAAIHAPTRAFTCCCSDVASCVWASRTSTIAGDACGEALAGLLLGARRGRARASAAGTAASALSRRGGRSRRPAGCAGQLVALLRGGALDELHRRRVGAGLAGVEERPRGKQADAPGLVPLGLLGKVAEVGRE